MSNFAFSSEDPFTISISSLETKVKPGEEAKYLISITNNDTIPINITSISFHPEPFHKEIQLRLENSIPVNSTISFEESIKIPVDAKTDSYPIYVKAVTDQNITNTLISSVNVTGTGTPVEKFNEKIDDIALLLTIFVIPAAFVERIIQAIKTRHRHSKEHQDFVFETDQMIASLTKIRDKITESIHDKTKPPIYSGILHDLKEQEKSRKHDEQFITKLDETLSDERISEYDKDKIISSLTERNIYLQNHEFEVEPINKKIASLQQKKAEHQSTHEFHLWLVAIGISAIPATIFSTMDLGIFQIMGYDSDLALGADAFFNSLFIGSGTKPIHDIIGWIQKVRVKK